MISLTNKLRSGRSQVFRRCWYCTPRNRANCLPTQSA